MANSTNPLLCKNTFRVAQHDGYDDDAVVKLYDCPAGKVPISVNPNMCATIYESIIPLDKYLFIIKISEIVHCNNATHLRHTVNGTILYLLDWSLPQISSTKTNMH